ncbi:MAG: transcription antitermination factor NusB [Phycisphaerales bacterium]|jgi:N utilization substance protein B|nr:transcription antitermination factor NusB [Phycisphaerales bacterium]
MPQSRIIRQQALQLLCQFDAGNSDVASITDPMFDEERSETTAPNTKVSSLATDTWTAKEEADRAISALTPEWPIHRQPLVDRNILRLAYYEITSSRTPPIVAIDEAIELAKEFGTQESPSFVNGVLDKLFKKGPQEDTPNSETAAT